MLNLPTILKDEQSKLSESLSQSQSQPLSQQPPQFKRPKPYEYFTTKIPKNTIEMLCRLDKDERFLYFLKYGVLRRFEGEGDILYVEIPQIPKNLVIYRRPSTRNKYSEKLYLNKKDLPHIPLLEGEEYLKLLSLESNLISKIDHLISLNNLLFLNLYENKICEIENLSNIPKLKALMLGKNSIEKIKNLNCLPDLEVLDLHSNRIKLIENLHTLKRLRILNLANNQITSFVELMQNKNLEELNLRKNLIVSIPNLTNNFDKIKKINLGKNMISKIDFLLEFKKLRKLQELFIEDNPVLFLKDSYQKLVPLPIHFKDPAQYQIYQSSRNNNNNSNTNNVNHPNNNVNQNANGNNNKGNSNTNSNNIIQNQKTVMSSNKDHSNSNHVDNNNSSNNNNNNTNLTEEERQALLDKIKNEWELEYRYITDNGFNGYNIKKLKETKMQLCHVEIEREKQLNLFGNAIEVLTYNEFYNIVHTIHIEFLNFDIISHSHNIEHLKKFVNLKSISFSYNNIHSFYQLIKLEEIKGIEYITIKNNEICNSNLLKYFLVYRLQNIKYFNDIEITNKDVLISKKLFEVFDQAISYCENENEKEKAKGQQQGQKKKKEEQKEKEDNSKANKNAIVNKQNLVKINFYNYIKSNLFNILDDIVDV